MNCQRPAEILEGAFTEPAQIMHHATIIGQHPTWTPPG
jgi:hypothetical protein